MQRASELADRGPGVIGGHLHRWGWRPEKGLFGIHFEGLVGRVAI